MAAVVWAERIVAAQVLQRQPGHALLHRPQRHAPAELAALVLVAAAQQRADGLRSIVDVVPCCRECVAGQAVGLGLIDLVPVEVQCAVGQVDAAAEQISHLAHAQPVVKQQAQFNEYRTTIPGVASGTFVCASRGLGISG